MRARRVAVFRERAAGTIFRDFLWHCGGSQPLVLVSHEVKLNRPAKSALFLPLLVK